jgi:hypothetical protein
MTAGCGVSNVSQGKSRSWLPLRLFFVKAAYTNAFEESFKITHDYRTNVQS